MTFRPLASYTNIGGMFAFHATPATGAWTIQ